MRLFFRFFRFLLRPFFFLFAHTVNCGAKRQKKAAPLIAVGNHLSMSDIIVSGLTFRRPSYFLGKKELLNNKFVGKFLLKMGIIPVDRGEADIKAMRTIFKVLKDGSDLTIYPEGTRNKVDNRLCKILSGAAMFAIKSKTPVMAFAFNRAAKFGHVNYVIYSDPFDLSQFYDKKLNAETLREADTMVKERMIQVKRLVDYLGVIKGKKKKLLIRQLRDERIPFNLIYNHYEPYLLSYETSVAPDDFDQSVRPDKSAGNTKK